MNTIPKIPHKVSISVAVGGLLVFAGIAYAQTGIHPHPAPERPIVGTVSAASNGELFLVIQASSTAAITTYTVETGKAKILKAGATTTAAGIAIGDKIAVIGVVSGTDIAARVIIDGFIPRTTGPPAWKKGGRTGSTIGRSFASSTRPFMRPAAFGSVSAIAGTSFSLAERTKTGTTTLTIDTDPSTAFREGTTTASFSSLAVGNLVAVTGSTTATDEILASKVQIMPEMPFGKGRPGDFGGMFREKKPTTSR